MKCPRDETELTTNYRHGIEVDMCTTCQGAWLDRGELDKILAIMRGDKPKEDTDPTLALDTATLVPPVPRASSSKDADNMMQADGSGIADFFSDLFGSL